MLMAQLLDLKPATKEASDAALPIVTLPTDPSMLSSSKYSSPFSLLVNQLPMSELSNEDIDSAFAVLDFSSNSDSTRESTKSVTSETQICSDPSTLSQTASESDTDADIVITAEAEAPKKKGKSLDVFLPSQVRSALTHPSYEKAH